MDGVGDVGLERPEIADRPISLLLSLDQLIADCMVGLELGLQRGVLVLHGMQACFEGGPIIHLLEQIADTVQTLSNVVLRFRERSRQGGRLAGQ